MKKYPSLLFDSERIKDLRRRLQKPLEREELYAFMVLRKISIFITLIIKKVSFIRPNHVTILGILFGVMSAISFIQFNVYGLMFGLLFYNLSYLADCVDGELARLSNEYSDRGYWLDSLLRYMLYLANLSFVFSFLLMIRVEFNILIYILLLYLVIIMISIFSTDSGRLLDKKRNDQIQLNISSRVLLLIFSSDVSLYTFSLVLYLLMTIDFLGHSNLYHIILQIFVYGQLFTFLLKTIRNFFVAWNEFES